MVKFALDVFLFRDSREEGGSDDIRKLLGRRTTYRCRWLQSLELEICRPLKDRPGIVDEDVSESAEESYSPTTILQEVDDKFDEDR
ncbi:hypothetical protein WAI453_009258 [Rhynchosporium graminicola]